MGKSNREVASRKAVKCRLLDADLTLAICADHREAGCASSDQLKASWKHLKRRCRQVSKQTGRTITAIPTQCVDVCKFGPLMSVTATGAAGTSASGTSATGSANGSPVWLGQCTPEAIDRVLEAALTGEPLPPELVLTSENDD